jgi:hypothetical protein
MGASLGIFILFCVVQPNSYNFILLITSTHIPKNRLSFNGNFQPLTDQYYPVYPNQRIYYYTGPTIQPAGALGRLSPARFQ